MTDRFVAHKVTVVKRIVSISFVCATLAACGPAGEDELDGGGNGVYDTDGDGLCDSTEATRGTGRLEPDTDGDGIPDGVEYALDYDELVAGSPEEANVVRLLEEADTSATLAFDVEVNADGTDVTAGLQRGSTGGLDVDVFDDYASGVVAVSAYPAENVANVETSRAIFRQVRGQTRLSFEARVRFPADAAPFGCSRLMPFRLVVKTTTGNTLAIVSRALIVEPRLGASRDVATWCDLPYACY